MRTAKIKQTNIIYSSAEKHAVNGGNNFVAHGRALMCPPSKKNRFVKLAKSKRETSSGYVPVSHEVATDESIPDRHTGASSYSDFILYNYGAASERQHASDSGEKS